MRKAIHRGVAAAFTAALLAALIIGPAQPMAESASVGPGPASAQISKKKHRTVRLECPSHGGATRGNVNFYEIVDGVVGVIAAKVIAQGFTLEPMYGKYTGSTCVKLGPNAKRGYGQVDGQKTFPDYQYPVTFEFRFYMDVTLNKKGRASIVISEMRCVPPGRYDPNTGQVTIYPGCFTPTYP
jgi:hypothetical protein